MFLQRIHHIAIICSDYERSKNFYVHVLGLSIIKETFRAERNSFKLDLAVAANYQIELFSFPDPPVRVNNPEAQGLRHLAFAVKDLDACVRHLTQHQVVCEPVRIDTITNKRFTFFSDPDGLPLELYEE
ncbi:SMU1112c/YaeR family gloxylase I-like metalloprotein [Adhaeribacter pallidiroseus]|uniref:VOC domain-containing protein n=1 Tax=Adhaeribacter pallidiroseus TaxID=2072847 RepID=A0A369QRF3_9BACT|nr:VOC family protein [Adhaeribacter pallidiroseus]RDC65886.1 uncharacterized protein AHMF7616_04517 [Adhaeribacter pallidiroseus]